MRERVSRVTQSAAGQGESCRTAECLPRSPPFQEGSMPGRARCQNGHRGCRDTAASRTPSLIQPEYRSAQGSTVVPISLQVKTPHHGRVPPRPASRSSWTSPLPLASSTPAVLASYLFLTLDHHASASGPLHQLFPLPGTLLPPYQPGSALTSFRFLFTCSFSVRPPWPPY